MNKAEQFKHFTDQFKGEQYGMLDYFLSTEGCYVISTEVGLVLAYRTNIKSPKEIDLQGTDLYITYLTGDILEFVEFCSDEIENLIFERNDKVRIYNLKRLKHKITKY